MKLKNRVEFKKVTLMFKAMSSSDVPIYLQTKFKKVSSNHNLRAVENTMLHDPRPKLEFFRNLKITLVLKFEIKSHSISEDQKI